MLEIIKKRCGIAKEVTAYNEEIELYMEDCKLDMLASGVPESIIRKEREDVVTAVTLYVKAYIGNDRTDTDDYLKLYGKKVFRLSLEEEDVEQEHIAAKE